MYAMFTGTLMGMSNCLATIPGFLGPYIVGRLTDHNVSHLIGHCNTDSPLSTVHFHYHSTILLYGTGLAALYAFTHSQNVNWCP